LKSGDNSSDSLGATRRWIATAYLGLLSRTFSTVVSQLSAARIGRDALVDWMSVAAIPARDWALTAEPSICAIAVGIAFHQWADFSWALVFFGVLGKWTANRGPLWLAGAAVPWARMVRAGALVSVLAADLHFQQPYWIGFLVHLSSASVYPLFTWLRRSPSERRAFGGHSYGYGAWPHLPEFSSLGLLQFSPATIANCLGWVGILPSTRPSSGICRPITNREFCWPRWLPREPATRACGPFRSSWCQAAAEAFALTLLRSATVLSLVFAAFSSFRLQSRIALSQFECQSRA
jgi:hypothetical protein